MQGQEDILSVVAQVKIEKLRINLIRFLVVFFYILPLIIGNVYYVQAISQQVVSPDNLVTLDADGNVVLSGNFTGNFTGNSAIVQSASFIIDVSGSTYRAWHGSNSTLFTSSTNASAVINNAIGNLTNGGKLSIKEGTYALGSSYIDITIATTNPIEIVGMGDSTNISYAGSGGAIRVHGGSSDYYFKLGNFRLDGLDKTVSGRFGIVLDSQIGRNAYVGNVHIRRFDYALIIDNANTVFVDHFKIVDCAYGIKAINGLATYPNAVFISDFKISSITNRGIWIENGNQVAVERGTLEICDTGIFAGTPNSLAIRDVYFEQNSWEVYLYGGATASDVVESAVLDNLFMAGNTTPPTYAIALRYVNRVTMINPRSYNHGTFIYFPSVNDAGNITIINPDVTDTALLSASSTQIKWIGLGFENSGSWTGSSPVTVAHGCAGTPTIVNIGVNAAQPYATSWTADATNIVIYHNGAGSLSGSWSCEYKP